MLRTLGTSAANGLSGDAQDLAARQEKYGENIVPQKEIDSWLDMFIASFNDATLILLIVSAVVSLAVGGYEGWTKVVPAGAAVLSLFERYVGCVEGFAILTSVLLVAAITATQEHDKETKFQELNIVSEDVRIAVQRAGAILTISASQVVVGDVVRLEAGDQVPADGIFLSGSDVHADESGLTGEPEEVAKSAAAAQRYLFSGSRLTSGCCLVLVVAVGPNSEWGRVKAGLDTESTNTPLQESLETLAEQIGYAGMAFAAATFLALLSTWYFTPVAERTEGLFETVLGAFIIAVTIVVVAIPEGLPLAVTISLAYSTKKMMADNNLIRILAACETMGNATTICSDKTGTLTQNRMTVVAGWVADEFVDGANGCPQFPDTVAQNAIVRKFISQGISINSTASLTSDKLNDVVGSKTEGALLKLLRDSFKVNYVPVRASGFDASAGDRLYTFSSERKTMSVFLCDSDRACGDTSVAFVEESKEVQEEQEEQEEARKKNNPRSRSRSRPRSAAASTSPRPSNGTAASAGGAVSYTKGAPEYILKLATHYTTASGAAAVISSALREELLALVQTMASNALRTIALAHKVHGAASSPRSKKGPSTSQLDDRDFIESALQLDGIFGIKDPIRPDVPGAVRKCQQAGILVRMVTGDSMDTAMAIARECGILTEGGKSLEGAKLRAMTPAQLDAVLPHLQVVARSSPEDKRILVTRLNGKQLPADQEEWEQHHPGCDWDTQRDLLLPGYKQEWEAAREGRGELAAEVVGVTGDGTNDGPALKAADVGLSMGLSGTDVAKAASDIVILDDNFASIVKAVMWGRSIFDNIRKFLQFQLTVNVVALTVTFLSAVSGKEPPLNAVMMLWVNLIMDTMGALALGTEAPAETLLERMPFRKDASLISRTMWRNIASQSVFQIALLAYLLAVGHTDFGVVGGSMEHTTIIFTTFVLCQMFNEVNARSIGSAVNVFHGIFDNVFFMGVLLVTAGFQYALVEWPSVSWLVRTTALPFECWRKCALLAGLTLPVGGLMRFLPVTDRKEDVAQLPAFVRELTTSHAGSSTGRTGPGLAETLSFAVWWAASASVAKVALEEFGPLWMGHLQALGGHWAAVASVLQTAGGVVGGVLRTFKL